MIEFETDGHLAIVTINRPEARNAVNGAVASGIEEAIDEIESNDDIWVWILTGAGPTFSAGADLKEINAGNAAALQTERGGFAGIVQRDRCKPVIAAVNGPALAGGLEVAISCDMIVASEMATFGIPEVKRSLVAAAGGVFRLPKMVGEKIAFEMIATGDPITAERAYELGLVNHVCPPDEVLIWAKNIAGRVTACAPLAVQESLAIARKRHALSEAELFELSINAFGTLAQTDDFREGLMAFIEKRDPQWTGTRPD